MREDEMMADTCFCRDLPAGCNCTVCERQALLDDAASLRREAAELCVRHNAIMLKLGEHTVTCVRSDPSVDTLTHAMLKRSSVKLLADLLNEALAAEQDDRLSEEEHKAYEWLFDVISYGRPDAVKLSQGE